MNIDNLWKAVQFVWACLWNFLLIMVEKTHALF